MELLPLPRTHSLRDWTRKMLKYIEYPGVDEYDNPFVSAIVPEAGLEKTAAAELHPEVVKFIGSLKKDPKKLYVLVNALTAGEFYGSIVADSIIAHNSADFHYDRNLGNLIVGDPGPHEIVAFQDL